MTKSISKIKRQQDWESNPNTVAFRQRFAAVEHFANAITNENITEALVDRLATEIDTLWGNEILNSQEGYEEFTPEINRLTDLLAALDHEMAQKRRRQNHAS
jgi:hypothetical protein